VPPAVQTVLASQALAPAALQAPHAPAFAPLVRHTWPPVQSELSLQAAQAPLV
jgi:hypothetical protein